MKPLMAGMIVLSVALTGCNRSQPGGGEVRAEQFKITAPAMATTIKQGDSQTVTLSLDRGKDFKQDVALKVDAPAGLNAELAAKDVKASDKKDVSLTIKADEKAPIGEHVVRVTGTPESGAPTSVEVKVKVQEKS